MAATARTRIQTAGRVALRQGKQLQTNAGLTAGSVGPAMYEAYFTFKINIILVTLYEI
jgi:hypothetical protein